MPLHTLPFGSYEAGARRTFEPSSLSTNVIETVLCISHAGLEPPTAALRGVLSVIASLEPILYRQALLSGVNGLRSDMHQK